MEIGFNKKTLLLAWDIIILYALIRAFAISFDYWLPDKQPSLNEIYSISLVALSSVAYLMMHTFLEKEEPANSS